MSKNAPKRSRQTSHSIGDRARDRQTFHLADEIEEPLARAVSYAGALELIGFGLCRIGDEHGQAVIALAEAMTADLAAVQKVWRQMVRTPARRRANRRTKA